MLLVRAVGAVAVMVEALHSSPPEMQPTAQGAEGRERPFVAWMWALSMPAIAAQLFIIKLFGGIQGYINIIGNRVVELRGLGWAKTVIGTIVVINLIYFAIGLTRRRGRVWWLGYLLHFAIVLGFGLLSGSRGSLLNVFAMQLFLYHYLRRRVRLTFALPAGAILVLVAVVLGVAREGIRVEGDSVSTGLDKTEDVLRLATFSYGVEPLRILSQAEQMPLAYGSTLLSLVTNAVPRDWWPDKPDTGGIYFTKQYTGDAWDGASNLTPTFLGEAVINFGWAAGLPVFFLMHALLMCVVVASYRSTLARVQTSRDAATAIRVVLYVLIMWSVVALMIGEVTNVLLTLVLTQIIPALGIRTLLVKKR
jgi:hypothetical protein